MTIDLFSTIALVFFGIGFFIAMVIIVLVLLAGFVCSSKYEKEYKICIINIISSCPQKSDLELEDAINAEYQHYRNRKINAFAYLDVMTINFRLISELRLETYTKYYKNKIKNNDIANKLERVNKKLQQRSIYKEEKLEELLSELTQNNMGKEGEVISQKTRNLFETCISWCDGRLYEKDGIIQNLNYEKQKMKTSKLFSGFLAFVGLASSLITIFVWLKDVI